MYFYFIVAGIFVLFGLAVHVFKWYFLIPRYNTMVKEKVDLKGISRLIGFYSYMNSLVFLVFGILHARGIGIGMIVASIFFLFSTIYLLTKGPKHSSNLYDENGKLKKGAGIQIAMPLGIIGAVVVAVGVLMIFSSLPTKVTFLEEGLKVHGMYGGVYDWESIEEIELMESMPEIILKTNGSALGPYLKGYFKTEEFGEVKLFVNKRIPPFLYIKTKDRTVILNLSNAEKTKETYRNIFKIIN